LTSTIHRQRLVNDTPIAKAAEISCPSSNAVDHAIFVDTNVHRRLSHSFLLIVSIHPKSATI
jgi:hypothetical protein